MTNLEPVWRLTDDALRLVIHAEHDMAEDLAPSPRDESNRAPLRATATGRRLLGSTATAHWTRESAVVRIVTAVESYADAASQRYFALAGTAAPTKFPFTWPQRRVHYETHHGIDLSEQVGWDQVAAGIDLRNCLAHGLGALTGLLVRDEKVVRRMHGIEVDVHSARMHLRPTTVSLLAGGCRDWVLDLETALVARLLPHPESRRSRN